MEIVIAVAVVAILAAALSPVVFRQLKNAKVAKAQNEVDVIAKALSSVYKDTGKWPYTNANGPAGRIDRLASSRNIATGAGAGAGSAAHNWGRWGTVKQLGDFLYYNNPDDNSGARAPNEAGQDYPTSGEFAWQGPYMEQYSVDDPWGHAYMVNVRYMPGGRYSGSVSHNVMVLSAGPDGRWQTDYNDSVTEQIRGDDIGTVLMVQ